MLAGAELQHAMAKCMHLSIATQWEPHAQRHSQMSERYRKCQPQRATAGEAHTKPRTHEKDMIVERFKADGNGVVNYKA
jgi:hypothetical protein